MFFRGYFSQGDQRYFIEPLSATHQDEQKHALYKYEPYAKTNSSCGMDDVLWAHAFPQNVASPATSLDVCKHLCFICNTSMCLVWLPWVPVLAAVID